MTAREAAVCEARARGGASAASREGVRAALAPGSKRGGMESGGLESGAAAAGPAPGRFPFPYTPYRIQEQFMEALYGALEAGRVGIFESPTGTVRRRDRAPGHGAAAVAAALLTLSALRDRENR